MNNTFTLSEQSLIENCINRNRKSQKELFERFSPKMMAICLQYAKDQIDAEDILQNAFVKLFNSLHKFKGDEPFEEWVRKFFINTAAENSKRNKVKVTITEDFKNIATPEHITAIDGLYENIYTKTSSAAKKDNDSVFKLYAVDGFSIEEMLDKPGTTKSNAKTQPEAEKKSPIRVVHKTASKNHREELKYTIQKGDDRRLNKDGVLRVYNLSEPFDIPVKKVLGKWKQEYVGITLVLVNEKWHIEDEKIKHVIQRHKDNSSLVLKRLLNSYNKLKVRYY